MFIYIMTDEEMFKIGLSKNPRQRRSAITHACGRKITLIQFREIPDKYARKIETHAHTVLAKHRTFGEWFRCTQSEAVNAVGLAITFIEKQSADLTQNWHSGYNSGYINEANKPRKSMIWADLVSR